MNANEPTAIKRIADFAGYFVDDMGNVYSRRPRNGLGSLKPDLRRLKATENADGYFVVSLYRENRRYVCKVHRLVLTAFVGECPAQRQGCHNNGNKADNRLANLRWDTAAGNCRDRVLHGRQSTLSGERSPSAKLTESDVRAIRQSSATQDSLAATYRVAQSTISKIKRRLRWRHVG